MIHLNDAFSHINTFFSFHSSLICSLYIQLCFFLLLLEFFPTYHSEPCQIITQRRHTSTAPAPAPAPASPPVVMPWSKRKSIYDKDLNNYVSMIPDNYHSCRDNNPKSDDDPLCQLSRTELAISYQNISSCQHMESWLRQLESQLHMFKLYILSVGKSIMSNRRMLNENLLRWHRRTYHTSCLIN